MNSVEMKLLQEMQKIKIIDTHEHLMERQETMDQGVGVLELFRYSYVFLDFINSGLSKEIFEKAESNETWKELEESQKRLKLTSFMRMLTISLRDLYGFDGGIVTENNWKDIDRVIKESYKNKDWYREILQDKCNFSISFLDHYWNVHKIPYNSKLFLPVLRVDPFILGRKYTSLYPEEQNSHTTIEEISREWQMSINTFSEYLTLIDYAIKKYKNSDSPAIKICTAYERSLSFKICEDNIARKLYSKNPESLSIEEKEKLQNYMAHYVIKEATKNNMPIQIHTGYLARTSAMLSNSNPEKLNNLFILYPNTKFVIFHFGYPYYRTAISLAKIFKNVYIDFCWVPALSDKIAVEVINEFFELVPYNKIMWGGDAERLEDAYSSTVVFKEVIAKVLRDRIISGEITFSEAIEIIKAIFYKNANDFYNLGNKY